MNLKTRVNELLRGQDERSKAGKLIDLFLIALITLNVLAVIAETVEQVAENYQYYFDLFEIFSVAIFTLELVLRIWSITAKEGYGHPIIGRLKFLRSPLTIIDLLAIVPFYLPMIFPLDLRIIRVLRLFRLLRLLKLGRYSESMKTLGNVFRVKREELTIAFMTLFLLLLIISSLIYFVENEAQPNAFPDIPSAMWWGIVTLTTVGYGDVYPITVIGKFLGAIAAILGIGMFALPAGIVASGFAEEIQRKRSKTRTCPHCGKEI